jgi:hypothetical protein
MPANLTTADGHIVVIDGNDVSWFEDQPNGTVRVQLRSNLQIYTLQGNTISVSAQLEQGAEETKTNPPTHSQG